MTSEFSRERLKDGLRNGEFRKVVFLVGAGVSVAAGIPDFRTPKIGLYAQVKSMGLPVPEDIFSLEYFLDNPVPFYRIAGKFLFRDKIVQPVYAHYFMKAIEDRKQLLMVYTQNIDGLELTAGISPKKVVQAHGHMRSAHCISCRMEYPIQEFEQFLKAAIPSSANEESTSRVFFCQRCHEREFQLNTSTSDISFPEPEDSPMNEKTFSSPLLTTTHQNLTRAYRCDEGGIVKPDIIFFGEKVTTPFHRQFKKIAEADLVIVMGTSLKVHPFSQLLSLIHDNTPLVIMNKDLPKISRQHLLFLQGDIEETILSLCEEIGWTLSLTSTPELPALPSNPRKRKKNEKEENFRHSKRKAESIK